MSTSPLDELFKDERPITKMPFGAEEKTPEAREETATRVRALLEKCGVAVADDINQLGCTGVVAALKEPGTDTLSILAAQFLRLGLAGGGVGLPCFVPISRYCLVHETIGGLEPGQAQHHPEFVEAVSRGLTPEEHGKVALVEQARRRGRKDPEAAADILGGRDESLSEEKEETPTSLEQQLYEARLAAGLQATAREQAEACAFKCPEHSKLNWACRHCIAQAIVEGELEPVFFVTGGKPGDEVRERRQALGEIVLGSAVEGELGNCDARGDTEVDVYVRVATFTRKLSRN